MKKLVLLILLASSVSASAHSWYSINCCGGEDCKPVPCDELTESGDGSYKWQNFAFAKAQVHPSQDKDCHVCIHDYQGAEGMGLWPMCVYIQQGVLNMKWYLIPLLMILASPVQATIIRDNEGGCVGECPRGEPDFRRLVRTTPGPIRITGSCFSACTMYLGRKDACTDPDTLFGFHQAYWVDIFGFRHRAPKITNMMEGYWPPRLRAAIAPRLPFKGHLFLRGSEMAAYGVKVCAAS